MTLNSVLLTSSVLILVILLLRWLLRGKVGNVFLYALWLVVAVRLLMPVPEFFLEKVAGIEKPWVDSSVSVMNLVVRLTSHWENDIVGQGSEVKNTDTAQEGEVDSREPEVPENMQKQHVYEKKGGGGGGSSNFPQSLWRI